MLAVNRQRDLLKTGIAAAKQGDKATAREKLLAAAELAPNEELAWLWLASVATHRGETVSFLEKALAVNPADERTRSWLERVRAGSAQKRKHWRCPFCHGESLVEVAKCPQCRAVVRLDDLDSLLANTEADGDILKGALERLEGLSGDAVTFEVHLAIALGYLNLRRTYEGLTRLRVARQLKPEDGRLSAAIEELARRQEAAVRAAAYLRRPAAPGQPRRTILVVDDSPTVLKIVGVALERQGHEVLVAGNALQALAKLDDAVPDLILLDVSMPHMDGYQLCKLVRANAATRGVPVVMLSGRDGFFDKVRGRLAGATDYITKPFDPAHLVKAVEQHCPREAHGG